MKLKTTFWSETVHTFDQLFFINNKTNEIAFQTNLGNYFESYVFFKNISQFVKSKKVRQTIDDDYGYQFAVMFDGDLTPVKWFKLHINDSVIISHDIAFDTTIISKNGIHLSFGQFPMWYHRKKIKLPKYRSFHMKSKAYKYMSNQIKHHLL